ncbi:MAG: glycoside hydrolase family 127 protein [Anaerolineae bacterium]|nr:glycoside hydrolase family 127 protein [Anaerolineae bacterium]
MEVNATNSPYARYKTIALKQIALTDGFWLRRQTINHQTSVRHAFRKLETSGNFNNLKLAAGTGEGQYREPLFMDSDIYKWLEAVSYSLITRPDPELAAMADEAIALLAAAQQEDGYLNSYFQVMEPNKKWTELAMGHELYCAGHLIEAAVAHHRATGQTKLLDIACRFADHIDGRFGPDKGDAVPGHPEIELALVELHRETDEPRYLALAGFFIDQRGHGKMIGRTPFENDYHQNRVPVRETDVVEGHAVRQLYLTAGIADIYLETGEQALLDTLQRQWHDMTAHKMHITAGFGARHEGEAFGQSYELPSDRCYCETCAAIANMMWNWRMLLITGEARYADLLERSLYNGFLSGISLDGQRYFYVNPLLSRGGIERPEWYGCACCPPNVMRQIAMLAGYVATTNAAGLQVHQYIATNIEATLHNEQPIKVQLETDYPWDGQVTLTIAETDGSPWELALRIPGWCHEATLHVGDDVTDVSAQRGGYAQTRRTWQAGDVVQLKLVMQPRFIEPNPRIDAVRGSLAIERGPLVYCLEAVDQPADVNLPDVRIDPTAPLHAQWREDMLEGVVVIEAQGTVMDMRRWQSALYRPLTAESLPQQVIKLTAVPYYAWANRGPGQMRVWIAK